MTEPVSSRSLVSAAISGRSRFGVLIVPKCNVEFRNRNRRPVITFDNNRRIQALETAIRAFLAERGVTEVRTPVLSPTSVPEAHIALFGSEYRPPAWSGIEPTPLKLLPSPELFLKKLLADGWPSLFSFAPSFRNEESISPRHCPEFTMLEIYLRETDYSGSLQLFRDLFDWLFGANAHDSRRNSEPATTSAGLPAADFPQAASLAADFEVLTLAQAFETFAGVDLTHAAEPDRTPSGDAEALRRMAKAASATGLSVNEGEAWDDLFHRILLTHVEPCLSKDRCTVLIDYPARLASTARSRDDSPWAERWELYLGTLELANVYTEETNGGKLRQFFENELKIIRNKGIADSRPDLEFIEASTKLGLVSGSALGLERLAMAATGVGDIADFRIHPWTGRALQRR